MLAKLGEIALKLDRDVKKDDKLSLNDVLSLGDSHYARPAEVFCFSYQLRWHLMCP